MSSILPFIGSILLNLSTLPGVTEKKAKSGAQRAGFGLNSGMNVSLAKFTSEAKYSALASSWQVLAEVGDGCAIYKT